jgi:Xaa-Pro aminopeptidase
MTSAASDVAARVPFGWEDRAAVLELDFPIEEFQRRIGAVQAQLIAAGLDALVAWGGAGAESDVRYLSGFGSWWGDTLVVVLRSGEPTLITNAIFHGEPMHSNVQTTWIKDVRPLLNPQSTGHARDIADLAADVLHEHGASAGKIAITPGKRVPGRVERALADRLPAAQFVDGTAATAAIRKIKSGTEIELLRRLGRATTAGMDAGLAAVRAGVTEAGIAGAVHGACIAAGAERMDFGCFPIGGPRSFMKNVFPRVDKRIEQDELVVIDIGAKLGGYQSDMSRNIVAGEPSAELVRLLDTCLEAQEAGLATTGPGVPIAAVLDAMTRVIVGHGYAEWEWSTGHGFGLDIVEEPIFFPGNQALLEPGMCFFIEPMIVPTEVGTICIEDMVLVTEDGCEELTLSPKRTW